MKLLYLNTVITKANEKGEEKIQKAMRKSSNTNDGSLPLSWYEEQGLRPPKDLEQEDIPEISQDGMMYLKEGEFEYEEKTCILRLSDFSCCIDNDILGSVVYTKDGDEIWCFEEAYEIASQIEYLSLSWLERLKIKINRLINRE